MTSSTRVVLAATTLLVLASPASGQSIFNSAGLGLPLEALDGRARALGSFGLGLPGGSVTPSDPAAAARVLLPSGVIAVQPSWTELSEASTNDPTYFKGTRFPLIALAYPVRGGMMTVHAMSVFDQRFSGQRSSDVTLGGTLVPVVDAFTQEGSLSSLALGYARMVGSTTSVGLSVGRYTGTLRRTLSRAYGAGAGSVEPYQSSGSWRYAGESVTAGVTSDALGAVRVAASATWSTDITADPTGQTTGGDRIFDLPLQLRVGASSVLTPGLILSASAMRANWETTQDNLGSGSYARAIHGFGVGLELSRARLLGREAPLRLGFRRAGLPFSLDSEPASERAFTGGVALVLGQANGEVLASTDIALERGRRSAGTFAEDFWRGTLSLRLSGF